MRLGANCSVVDATTADSDELGKVLIQMMK